MWLCVILPLTQVGDEFGSRKRFDLGTNVVLQKYFGKCTCIPVRMIRGGDLGDGEEFLGNNFLQQKPSKVPKSPPWAPEVGHSG